MIDAYGALAAVGVGGSGLLVLGYLFVFGRVEGVTRSKSHSWQPIRSATMEQTCSTARLATSQSHPTTIRLRI